MLRGRTLFSAHGHALSKRGCVPNRPAETILKCDEELDGEWSFGDAGDVVAEFGRRSGQFGRFSTADPVLYCVVLPDDCAEPAEAEEVAGDAGKVEGRRSGDDQR